jgi:hypothetical protein
VICPINMYASTPITQRSQIPSYVKGSQGHFVYVSQVCHWLQAVLILPAFKTPLRFSWVGRGGFQEERNGSGCRASIVIGT